MKFVETKLPGAFIVEAEPIGDERGFFYRAFCAREFKVKGLAETMVQGNLSVSIKKNTLRGMHFQVKESAEDKLVRCIQGRILDVIIDIRDSSPTFGQHEKIELSFENKRALYVPRGFAHGFLTCEDNCCVQYLVSNFYSPENERGIRWNDPMFHIDWPICQPIISRKDASYADFSQ